MISLLKRFFNRKTAKTKIFDESVTTSEKRLKPTPFRTLTEKQQVRLNNPQITSISERIEQSFPHSPSGDAFVASVYGEWGTGKTWCLAGIYDYFQQLQQKQITNLTDEVESIYVPVLFSPWRYEQEAHLVVPLLKTLQKATEQLSVDIESTHNGGQIKGWLSRLGKAVVFFADFGIAMAAGARFKLNVGFAEMGYDIGSALKKASETRDEPENPDRIADMESIYYDCFESLEKFTDGEEQGDTRLKYVLLVDDLDRCLPEKAVEMLESIKLFLNIRNFAFVIAVDEEVVERGINHRYKDYIQYNLLNQNHSAAVDTESTSSHQEYIQPPITGSEYLEKIVHLPLYLPRWSVDRVEHFLLSEFGSLFTVSTVSVNAPESKVSDENSWLHDGLKSKSDSQQGSGLHENLLRLFKSAIPPIPRKLIRVAEATSMRCQQIKRVESQAGAKRGQEPFTEEDLITIAKLVILQQLYPPIYRLVRNDIQVFTWLHQAEENEEGAFVVSHKTISGKERLQKQFCHELKAALRNRYVQNPLNAFSGDSPYSDSTEAYGYFMKRFINLDDQILPELSKESETEAVELAAEIVTDDKDFSAKDGTGNYPNNLPESDIRKSARRPAKSKEQKAISNQYSVEDQKHAVASFSISDAQVIASLLQHDRDSRRAFIAQNDLVEKRLSNQLFANLIKHLSIHDQETSMLTDLSWLEDMTQVLDIPQTVELYGGLGVLQKVHEREMQNEEAKE